MNQAEVDDRVDTPPQSLNRGSNPRNRRLAIEEVEDRANEVEISRLAGALVEGPALDTGSSSLLNDEMLEALGSGNSGSIRFSDLDILILKAVEGQLLNNVYIVGSNGAALGRHSASNDIVISESFVSRRHCQIKFNSLHAEESKE